MKQVILLTFLIFHVFAQSSPNYAKTELTEAVSKGAVCIDGTPGAYYFRPGYGDGKTKWYIHHEGGGWCSSYADCYGRSLTPLGSSKNYPDTIGNNNGYFSINQATNPLMYNWNSVYLKYCDGGSFSGNNETVSDYQGHQLHFRGYRILQAAFDSLVSTKNLRTATDVVISGCSAGGLATYLHVDWWRKNLQTSSNRIVGMPDSGFFLDWKGGPNYHDKMIWTFTVMNATSGVNQECISNYARGGGETWHCFFAEHTSPFIQTPIFPLQSEYDSWQIGNDLGSNDPAQVNMYGSRLVELVRSNVLQTNAKNSVYLDSCYHHCGNWNVMHFDGLTQATAFQGWYNGTDTKPHFQGKPYPCDSCCK